MSFLNQQKGENDHRKYFMINLPERMLPEPEGIKPATSQVRILLCHWGRQFRTCIVRSYCGPTFRINSINIFQSKYSLIWGYNLVPFLLLGCRYCTKTTQVFFGHVFFSVTETDVTIKIYKEYSKMDWKRMKQMKQTNSSSHWWSVSFVSFVTKQDVTVQKTCSKLVTKHGETEWNDETYIFFF